MEEANVPHFLKIITEENYGELQMHRERSHTIHEDFFDPSMNTRRGLLSPGKGHLRKGTAGDMDDFSQFS